MLRDPAIEAVLPDVRITSPAAARYVNALRGRSRGIELLFERHSASALSGWFAYAYGKTRYTDVTTTETFWADFDPYSREPIGRCGTWTAGVQDPKTGANISYSGTVCPSSIGPVWSARAQGTYKGYGATWHGLSSTAKGAVAAGVVNNPPGSTASRTVRTRFSWTLK